MKYQITITALEPNPKAGERKYQPYGNDYMEPNELSRTVLTMELTAEQWDAIRRAALEVAK